jgi:hypothetical protein
MEQKDRILIVLVMVFFLFLFSDSWRIEHRRNAMDLCAWNARHAKAIEHDCGVFDDSPTRHWARILSCEIPCSFCGKKHDFWWTSQNGWDSMIDASDPDGEKRRQFKR